MVTKLPFNNFEDKLEYLNNLYYNVGQQKSDFELCYMDKKKDIQSKWRKWSAIGFDVGNKENKKWVTIGNNRTILKNEVVLDLEDPKRYNEILKRLESQCLSFRVFKTGSKGYHFHLIFQEEVSPEDKLKIIECFDCDTQKASARCMIAMEFEKHWKTGKYKELLKTGGEGFNNVMEILSKNNYEEENAILELKPLQEISFECLQMISSRHEDDATELIVQRIEKDNYIYTTRDDIKSEIWIYDDGIYKPNGESYIKEFVRNVLEKAYTPQRANKVVAKIEADTMIESDEFFNTIYLDEICVKNGILNLKTRELSDFTHTKIFFNKLPVDYNKTMKCDNIDKFFGEILKEKEDKKILYELAGFCLHKDYFIEKAFMFLGNGRNGKGKTLTLLKNFLGTENTCSVRLSQMEPQSSALCELHNRLVNLAGDLDNSALKDTGLFKELTGRDSIQVKRKYLRDLIFTNYAKMIFATNELPRVYDLSEGFWSRWILLEFPYQFLPQKEINLKSNKERKICKLQDPSIIEKITTSNELSGLLNMSLDGLDRLRANKDFSYSTGTTEVKNFWIRKSDSFTAFCLDNLEEDPEGHITKKELRQSFVKYCKTHKVKGASEINIKIVLENMFGVISGRKGSSYETQEAIWEGIVLKNQEKGHIVKNSKGRDSFLTTLGNKNSMTSGKTLPTLTILKNNTNKGNKGGFSTFHRKLNSLVKPKNVTDPTNLNITKLSKIQKTDEEIKQSRFTKEELGKLTSEPNNNIMFKCLKNASFMIDIDKEIKLELGKIYSQDILGDDSERSMEILELDDKIEVIKDEK